MQTQMQGPQPNTVQNQQKKPSRLTWRAVGFIVALLLIIVAGAIWISTGIGSLPNLLTTIFGIVGAILALFQLFPLFFPAKQTVTPDPPPPAPAQTPQIVINVPPSPLPVQPVPPQITPAEAASYRTISSNPPPTDPRTIQQRASVVKEVYTKLCEPDISALVLTGIGGLGKSTLTALVYKYTEEQRRAGNGPFKAEALWFSIDEKTTFVDLAGNLFAALGKPIPDFATMALTNQAAALFNALNAVTEARLIVLDQFENLLDQRTGHALPDRLGIGELIDALNSRSCSCRILLTSRPWPAGTRPYPPTHMQEYSVAAWQSKKVLTYYVNKARQRSKPQKWISKTP